MHAVRLEHMCVSAVHLEHTCASAVRGDFRGSWILAILAILYLQTAMFCHFCTRAQCKSSQMASNSWWIPWIYNLTRIKVHTVYQSINACRAPGAHVCECRAPGAHVCECCAPGAHVCECCAPGAHVCEGLLIGGGSTNIASAISAWMIVVDYCHPELPTLHLKIPLSIQFIICNYWGH
jgi:hypothetical protein